jgi:hypothetical protein
MKKFKSMVFSDENDIYMALHSNKSMVSDLELRKIAFSRGMIFSTKLNRDDLIDNISDLPFSYSQVKHLTSRLTPKVNRDQYSVKRIYGKFDFQELPDVVDKVITARPRTIGTEDIRHAASPGQFSIDIEYTEFDFTKGKYQQKRRHAGYIQFITQGETLTSIRYTFTPRIEAVLNEIIAEYKKIEDVSIDVSNIDLSSIVDAKLRNEFIDGLLTTNKDFIFLGMDKVRVSRVASITKPTDEPTPSLVEDDFEDSLDQDLLEDDRQTPQEEHLTNHDVDDDHYISDASFVGKRLDDCEEVETLCKRGFFMSRIMWHTKALFLKNKPTVVFELAFHEKYQGKELKFRIVGKRTYDPMSDSEVKGSIEGAEFDQTIVKLEELLFSSHDNVMKSLGDSDYPVQQEAS